jgi:L-asparagine transporter-like permease
MPTDAIVIVLMIMLVLQYLTMLNKGAGFLSKVAVEVLGEAITWETIIVWTLGVSVAGIALGILISGRYDTIDRWYASILLALMLGHCTCIWKTEDKSWRKAYLKERRDRQAK